MHVVRTGRELITTHRRTSYARHPVATADQCDVGRVTIDILPEDALLEIFDFYLHDEYIDKWYKLVHVCRKWRKVVLGSPHRLNLGLICNVRTPVRKTLYIWPVLPIFVWGYDHEKWGMDNIFAALEHVDRVCQLALLDIPSSELEKVLAAMQQPFPALTDLSLEFCDETPLVVSPSFLGGSAPLLQSLYLSNIPFPELPNLLSSATHLVDLSLSNIPYSGHFSPEMMATCLSALTRLKSIKIEFKSPRSRPVWKSRLPPPRTLLSFLTRLSFKGVCEYLEYLVARIDASLLDRLEITFFHQLIFDNPQLAQSFCRTPKIKAREGARVGLTKPCVWVTLPHTIIPQTLLIFSHNALNFSILCSQSDWQLSSLVQVCSSSFPQALVHTAEDLYIYEEKTSLMPWQTSRATGG